MIEKRWYTLENGRQVYRSVPKPAASRSDLPIPYVISDTLDSALYSGADGKQYTSKAALRATYKASGNPRGIEFTEVGNEITLPQPSEIKTSDKGIDESLHRAIQALS